MMVPGEKATDGDNVVPMNPPSMSLMLQAAAIMHQHRLKRDPDLRGTDVLPEKLGPEEDLGLRGQNMEIKNRK